MNNSTQVLEKLAIAEQVIEIDRHSRSKINPVASPATASAKRVMSLLDSE
jgi:hypothetical protein